jgi:hypothetical protein
LITIYEIMEKLIKVMKVSRKEDLEKINSQQNDKQIMWDDMVRLNFEV